MSVLDNFFFSKMKCGFIGEGAALMLIIPGLVYQKA